eukprot:gene2209-4296_t
MPDNNITEGSLKQQSIDQFGKYEWTIKYFRFHVIEGKFEVYDTQQGANQGSSCLKMSIIGAKFAREWSIASPLAGFGFDIAWPTGKIWSFLAENEASCRHWVRQLNRSILLTGSTNNQSRNMTPGDQQSFHDVDRRGFNDAKISTSLGRYDESINKHDLHDINTVLRPMYTGSRRVSFDSFTDPTASYGDDLSLTTHNTQSLPQPQPQPRSSTSFASSAFTERKELGSLDNKQSSNNVNMNPYHHHQAADSYGYRDFGESEIAAASSDSTHGSPPDNSKAQQISYASNAQVSWSSSSNLQWMDQMPPDVPIISHPHSKHMVDTDRDRDRDMNGCQERSRSHNVRQVSSTSTSNHIGDRLSLSLDTGRRVTEARYDDIERSRFLPSKDTTTTTTATATSSQPVSHTQPIHTQQQQQQQQLHIGENMNESVLRHHQLEHRQTTATGINHDNNNINSNNRNMSNGNGNGFYVPDESLRTRTSTTTTTTPIHTPSLHAYRTSSNDHMRQRHASPLSVSAEDTMERRNKGNSNSNNSSNNNINGSNNSNNSNSGILHEELLLSEKRQGRVLRLEKEEILAENAKLNSLLLMECRAKENVDKQLAVSRKETTALNDQIQKLETELRRCRSQNVSTTETWQSERELMRADADRRVALVMEDRDQAVQRLEDESREKMAQLAIRYERALREMELSIEERVREEIDSETMQKMSALHRRCVNEIETARLDERREVANQVEVVRATFLEREKETMDDLKRLEALHTERVDRLVLERDEYKQKLVVADDRLLTANEESSRCIAQLRQQTLDQVDQLQSHATQADRLKNDLHHAHQEIQSTRAREASYREQLGRLIEDSRLQHAELVQCQWQTSTYEASLSQLKRALHEANTVQATMNAELSIARDEVAMLEHEIKRQQDENVSLSHVLHRTESLVYGKNIISPSKDSQQGKSEHGVGTYAADQRQNPSSTVSSRSTSRERSSGRLQPRTSPKPSLRPHGSVARQLDQPFTSYLIRLFLIDNNTRNISSKIEITRHQLFYSAIADLSMKQMSQNIQKALCRRGVGSVGIIFRKKSCINIFGNVQTVTGVKVLTTARLFKYPEQSITVVLMHCGRDAEIKVKRIVKELEYNQRPWACIDCQTH